MSILGFRTDNLVQRKCWDCEGSGVHTINVRGRKHREICPKCNGLGVIESQRGYSWTSRLARAIGFAR